MLTKDLIRYDIKDDRILPAFIDPGDPDLQHVAEELLAVFKSAEGSTRAELLAATKPIIDAAPFSAIIARGLEKLLLDRTEFDTTAKEELIDYRREVFRRTSRWLSQENFRDYQTYQQQVEAAFGQPAAELAARLYRDLPDFQKVTRFKALSAGRLLHRYNAALVQALLLRCSELQLTVRESGAAALRQLFKYLRFRQLLATIRKDAAGHFLITIDGPLNLFYKTQKYGLNLALFFPAVLHQPAWQLTAQIRFKNRRSHRLQLDETCGLQPYSHQFLAYVPEEIRFFQEMFNQKVANWQLEPADTFVALEGEFYCFPDFTLRHTSGKTVALELFHLWHASHLSARLQQLAEVTEAPLLLGVSRVLLKDELIAGTVAASPYFARCGFVFREMPTVDKILPVLEKIEREELPGA